MSSAAGADKLFTQRVFSGMAEDVSENYREIPGPQLSTVVPFAGLLTESHLRLLQTVTKIHLCVFTFPPLAMIFSLALNE